MSEHNGTNGNGALRRGADAFELKVGLAEMMKNGVIMDVVDPEQAKVAEDAGLGDGAGARALGYPQGWRRRPHERDRDDRRHPEGRLDPRHGEGPDRPHHRGPRPRGDGRRLHRRERGPDPPTTSTTSRSTTTAALRLRRAQPRRGARRVGEGAAMIRTKGEAGGNIVEAVRHLRTVVGEMRAIQALPEEELMSTSRDMGAPYDLVRYVHANGKLPVRTSPRAASRRRPTPRCVGSSGPRPFVGSGIFKSEDPAKRARAVVHACTHWDDRKRCSTRRAVSAARWRGSRWRPSTSERLANRGGSRRPPAPARSRVGRRAASIRRSP